MYQQTAIHALDLLKNIANGTRNIQKVEEECRKIEREFHVTYEELMDLYNKMITFQRDVEKMGGLFAYEQSQMMWLKSELELLYVTYQFCQQYNLNIAGTSKAISKENLQLFPKTESQLQNTYYKLKNKELSFENIKKGKPGRKKKHESEQYVNEKEVESVVVQSEKTEVNLVTILSGIVDNFETIGAEGKKQELYQFMEGIYKLSSMAAGHIKEDNTQDIRKELQNLRAENERLRQEKEELISSMGEMTNQMNRFIESSDIDQIRTLPSFVNMCKQYLEKSKRQHDKMDTKEQIVPMKQ
ncbi:DNA-binding domain-containing protein [Bacillus pseudomycoides]|uniref:Motility repressor MogR n=1 Tax=Bacillus pseudomycoides TaxID=64104 RepID=A0A2B6RRU2_9BACI|nr:DNA-binding domain-containing protein [Bacillus pseudomycoides]PDY46620.1 motility repressor MogR [Bacillus pseudomycoides]PEA83271.1 motility repressor MogR [Bacillus pseudomycoides]PED10110.1 motility repressor MogR [Bacillus pseudomycoides]PED71962.1 motility repressor MogR [Bacillus pseudomycoides]PEI36193.1 motility repressor MogR [Bacillus pseudomycoides]